MNLKTEVQSECLVIVLYENNQGSCGTGAALKTVWYCTDLYVLTYMYLYGYVLVQFDFIA